MENQSLPWPIEKIINVAVGLHCECRTGASTGERIAAAFVLNRMDLLPANYSDAVEAWERLDDWQRYVKIIKDRYMHIVEERIREMPF